MQGTVPPITQDNAHDAKRFLDDVIQKVTRDASPEILQAGEDMLLGLAAIVIVWAGLRTAFEGFNAWSWIQTITGIMIPWSILHYYDTDLPGMAFTFPEAISGIGSWAMNVFMKDAVTMGVKELSAIGWKIYNQIEGSWASFSIYKLVFGVGKVLIAPIIVMSSLVFIFILFFALWIIVTAQVLWATLAIAIVTILGPLFIPFLLFEPLSFLFWGWFKTLITYSLYGAVAGAILRIFVGLGYAYMEAMLDPTLALGNIGNTLLWMVSITFLLLAGILAAFKVGEIAAGLVSGSGATGAGLMSTVATVVTAGKAAVAAGVVGATKAASAAKAAQGGSLPKLY